VDVNEVRLALVVAMWELHVGIYYVHKFIYKDIDATMSTSIQIKDAFHLVTQVDTSIVPSLLLIECQER